MNASLPSADIENSAESEHSPKVFVAFQCGTAFARENGSSRELALKQAGMYDFTIARSQERDVVHAVKSSSIKASRRHIKYGA